MINLDSQIITNRPENVYYFTGVANMEAAYNYIGDHVNFDHQVGCVMQPSPDGEGARCDETTIWYVIVNQELPSEFFTKASLTTAGEEILQQIIEMESVPPLTTEPVTANT
jgi:hypothetical protein